MSQASAAPGRRLGNAGVQFKKQGRFARFMTSEKTSGVVCALPFIIGFLVFLLVPILLSFYYTLTDYSIIGEAEFIGLQNYIDMFSDDKFFKSLGVTFFYALVSTPLRLVFALFVAMLLLKNSKVSGFYRAAYYLPSILGGSVAVAILWKQMFAADGVINQVLGMFGLETDFAWLGNESTAIWTLIILGVWQFGSSMLIFLASLKQIPTELYEAASVDGASKARQFWKITLPLLTPTIFFNLVMQSINGFLAFTQCYIITQGKPRNSTLFYMVYMYDESFTRHHAGYGAALAWVMLLIVGLYTGFLFLTKRFWVYDEEA
ncbi:carbohydrate ABC transporter permease [Bifidobacterium eulemuris]|uniref:ABC transporter, permease protein n=1 Tax=Bifidobacterium eulemuris TaxID=1765219 RepID=A0A261G7T3_9BIFI|nr:sugar ABC transporter permease [Bifidobacterium eulemuris]OZG67482.1 ABC transporter, permease protein [Bifidobacterium eulemuris]QOL33039.1 sugar ABC transporter permease [Bifidobacterium eulemuris]